MLIWAADATLTLKQKDPGGDSLMQPFRDHADLVQVADSEVRKKVAGMLHLARYLEKSKQVHPVYEEQSGASGGR